MTSCCCSASLWKYLQSSALQRNGCNSIAAERDAAFAGRSATFSGAEGTLSVQTLLPIDSKSRAVKGYSYRGQTFDEGKSGQSEAAPQWRLEVLPTHAQANDVFLHVLSTEDRAPDARLVQQGQSIGAQIGEARVLFEGALGGTLTDGGRTYPLRPTVETGRFE
jgi:hypothetical protein